MRTVWMSSGTRICETTPTVNCVAGLEVHAAAATVSASAARAVVRKVKGVIVVASPRSERW